MAKKLPNFIPASLKDYWVRSMSPLHALAFLMPMLAMYDLGIAFFVTDHDIYARRLLRDFFHWFGVTGIYLPTFMVAVVLLSWHIAKRDPWVVKPYVCGLMWSESLMLALPMFVLAVAMFRQPANAWGMLASPVSNDTITSQAKLVLSLGAGIYEELLFRLIAIAMIHGILVDLMKLPSHIGAICSVAISAVAFALYHFSAQNPFDWTKFIFYSGAGVYLAGVYLLRGFGIAAGTHALYDVLVVLLEISQHKA